jgi:hypothetical protein
MRATRGPVKSVTAAANVIADIATATPATTVAVTTAMYLSLTVIAKP